MPRLLVVLRAVSGDRLKHLPDLVADDLTRRRPPLDLPVEPDLPLASDVAVDLTCAQEEDERRHRRGNADDDHDQPEGIHQELPLTTLSLGRDPGLSTAEAPVHSRRPALP